MRVIRRQSWWAVGAAALLASTALAATVRPIGFERMVRDAEAIVRAEVVELSTFERPGRRGTPRRVKESVAPGAGAVAPPPGEPVQGIGVGVEGGPMIFTRITLLVDESIKGDAPSVLELTVPGGRLGDEVVHVFGLPRFEAGAGYLLFLRRGYRDAGDPVVGVSQGFFRIERDASGIERLVDHHDRDVTGIEGGRVVARASGPPPWTPDRLIERIRDVLRVERDEDDR